MNIFVHPTSIVDSECVIGEGTKIWHFCHILNKTNIGNQCSLGQNVVAGPNVLIGNNCKIQNNVSIYEGVTLEDDVFCGPSCVFTNVINPRSFIVRKSEYKNTIIRTGASLGANSTIICGINIGKYALIGAGALVKSDIANYALIVGVPGKQIGWVCKCGVTISKMIKNTLRTECSNCNSIYEVCSDKITPIIENV